MLTTRTCFDHLRQLRVVRGSLTTDTAHSLVRALVHSRLDYCNRVLASMFQYQIDQLQSVLRAAARLACPWSTQVGERFGRHARQTALAPLLRKGRVQTL